jgi:4-hydroxy-tetrahydrodipicolinate reductase
MELAGLAARHFDAAEIIELHHSGKEDAPSGTAENTAARMLRAARGSLDETAAPDTRPARGEARGRIRIHSVRLPGLVAHQEVIFGGLGQTLSIRHDSTSRESFMPGVLMAIRKVTSLSGLVVGLENLL